MTRPIQCNKKSVEFRGDILNSTPSHWTQINLIYRTKKRTYADAGVQSLIDESSMKDLAPASQITNVSAHTPLFRDGAERCRRGSRPTDTPLPSRNCTVDDDSDQFVRGCLYSRLILVMASPEEARETAVLPNSSKRKRRRATVEACPRSTSACDRCKSKKLKCYYNHGDIKGYRRQWSEKLRLRSWLTGP